MLTSRANRPVQAFAGAWGYGFIVQEEAMDKVTVLFNTDYIKGGWLARSKYFSKRPTNME